MLRSYVLAESEACPRNFQWSFSPFVRIFTPVHFVVTTACLAHHVFADGLGVLGRDMLSSGVPAVLRKGFCLDEADDPPSDIASEGTERLPLAE